MVKAHIQATITCILLQVLFIFHNFLNQSSFDRAIAVLPFMFLAVGMYMIGACVVSLIFYSVGLLANKAMIKANYTSWWEYLLAGASLGVAISLILASFSNPHKVHIPLLIYCMHGGVVGLIFATFYWYAQHDESLKKRVTWLPAPQEEIFNAGTIAIAPVLGAITLLFPFLLFLPAIALFVMIFVFIGCWAVQVLIGLPLHILFKKFKAHWLVYPAVGYGLGVGIWSLAYPLPSLAPYYLGVSAALQALATYYYGRPRQRDMPSGPPVR